MAVRLSASWVGRALPQEISCGTFSVRVRLNPRITVLLEGLDKLKRFNYLIRARTRDLPVCRIVAWRAPLIQLNCIKINVFCIDVITQLTNWFCGAEYHSKGHQLCSHSVDSQHFMEPEGSLPRSQELSNCTYPEQHQSSPQHSILSLIGPY
jgi:hypothetical protein